MYFFSITYLEVSMRFPVLQTLFVLVAALFLPTASYGQEAKARPTDEKTPTILFICEHGAAKSVIAAAYFDKLAKERGLRHRAVFRGTNPDPTLAAAAVKGLNDDGIDTRGWKPQAVTRKDLDSASAVVTLGCELPDKDAVAAKLTAWNDTPSVSQDYQAARSDIVKRVQSLVDSLAKKELKAKGNKKRKP
jgi:arsenate reductase (thioredoxin)